MSIWIFGRNLQKRTSWKFQFNQLFLAISKFRNRGRLFKLKNNLHKSLIFQLQSLSHYIFSLIPKKKSYRKKNMSKKWPRICRKELTKRQKFWTRPLKVFPISKSKIH